MSDESTCSSLSCDDLPRKRKYFEKRVVLAWKNVSVTVQRTINVRWWQRAKYETVTLLNNVSGICKPGALTAIMGASGAGKTTLLATLSQRIKHEPQGQILVNGLPISKEVMLKISGFVPQRDLVIDSLTVGEHMEFMAKLMMDQKIVTIHRDRRIYWLITEFGLSKCMKTKLKNLSGGELKRVSLAVQLLTDPVILFCDEPTTGLDSYSAGVVVEHLKDFAIRGKTVICTIHQPASGLFELFQDVILLAHGQIAYVGPVSDASSYFQSLGIRCPPSYNPAEFYVQQMAVFPGKEQECLMRNQWLCNRFAESDRGREVEIEVLLEANKSINFIHSEMVTSSKGNWSTQTSTTSSFSDELTDFTLYVSISKPSHWTQIYLLCWRSYKDGLRNYSDQLLRFFLFMFIAVLFTTPYINITDDLNQSGIQNMQGFLYMIITETIFTYAYSVFHTFPVEIPVFLREISNGLYKPGPYYFSKLLITLPKSVIETLIYSLFIFYVANLRGGLFDCLAFCCVVINTALSATAFGSLLSAAFEDVSTASLVSVPIEIVGVILCGTFAQLTTLPAYISWFKYLSQFYYGQEAVSILQWQQIDHIECANDPRLPCLSNGDEVLNNYGYHRDNFYLDLFGLTAIYICLHIGGFLCIWKRSKQQSTY